MDKLEAFIHDLNKIQRELLKSEESSTSLTAQNEHECLEKLANFLFNADTGWNILKAIYSQKIQVISYQVILTKNIGA